MKKVLVSVYWDGEYGIEDVCMSLQCVVGIEGVKNRVLPELDEQEIEGLKNSASVLKENLNKIEI